MTERDKPSHPPLILIANDQEWSARSLESILAPNGYAVLRAYTGNQALDRARTARPDLIVLDVQMPDIDGFEVCRRLRADPRFSHTTPIVITTAGPSGRAQRLEAYRAGAWEFLGQPLDGEALLLKFQTYLASKLEVDHIREEHLIDGSTGLYNMRGLARRAREIGAEAFRRHHALSCVVLGADPAPDQDAEQMERLAASLAERMGKVLREEGRVSDAIGRLGAAEFAVIAPGTAAGGAVRLVERLGQMLETAPTGRDHPAPGTLRVRAGYCAVPNFAESSVDAVEMLLRATSALRSLRNSNAAERVRAFGPEPSTAVS